MFKSLIKRVIISLDFKDVSESAVVTKFGREFQVLGTVQWKAGSEKVVLWNYEHHRNCGGAQTD